LTYWGLKPSQSLSIHMDWATTEQALKGFRQFQKHNAILKTSSYRSDN
jgi:hypothetical protein